MGTTTCFWDNMAKRYPHYNDSSMSKDVQTVIQWCQQKDVIFANASVLDIGSGTGTFSIPLTLLHAHVTAIDPSSKMLEILHEDALKAGVPNIATVQSDWDTFEIKKRYDIVMASMTPAIHDVDTIDKMISATQKYGIYITWGRYRINKLVNALLLAHHDDEPSANLGSIEDFMERLHVKHLHFEKHAFETAWSDIYSFDIAKEYAYEQLERRNIKPDETIVEKLLRENFHNGKVIIETKAEKAIILWKI